MWIGGTQSRRLKMLPLVGGKPRVFLGEKAVNPVWSPDGVRLAYQTVEAGDPIFVIDGDGSTPRQIFRDSPDKHNHYLTWSADGAWIYFVHGTPARHEMDLWRISASGGKPERLTQLNTEIRDPVPLSLPRRATALDRGFGHSTLRARRRGESRSEWSSTLHFPLRPTGNGLR